MDIQNTRNLLISSQKRKNDIAEYIANCGEDFDKRKIIENNILEFSKFLTLRGESRWGDVTPAVIQAYIILSQNKFDDHFDLESWLIYMKSFYEYLRLKQEVLENVFLKDEIKPIDAAEERITPEHVCNRCGKSLENKLAKYCDSCRDVARREIKIEWNRSHSESIKLAQERWKERHKDEIKELRREYMRRRREENPEKFKEERRLYRERNKEKRKEYNRRWLEKNRERVREYRRRYREKHGLIKRTIIKESMRTAVRKSARKKVGGTSSQELILQNIFSNKQMTDWCVALRQSKHHLFWMVAHKKRTKLLAAIEQKFSCTWEDKFREVFLQKSTRETAKILSVNSVSVMRWANHLGLKKERSGQRAKSSRNEFQDENRVKGLLQEINQDINLEMINISRNAAREIFEEILSQFPSRDYEIFQMRYFVDESMTLEAIADKYNLTRERVRQILEKMLSKLRHPTRKRKIREKILAVLFQGNDPSSSQAVTEIAKLQLEINQLKEKLQLTSRGKTHDIPLTEVELTVRAVNCLNKQGIKTVGQLANRTSDEVLAIRNMGKKTFKELRDVLASYGLKFKDYIM